MVVAAATAVVQYPCTWQYTIPIATAMLWTPWGSAILVLPVSQCLGLVPQSSTPSFATVLTCHPVPEH